MALHPFERVQLIKNIRQLTNITQSAINSVKNDSTLYKENNEPEIKLATAIVTKFPKIIAGKNENPNVQSGQNIHNKNKKMVHKACFILLLITLEKLQARHDNKSVHTDPITFEEGKKNSLLCKWIDVTPTTFILKIRKLIRLVITSAARIA